MTDGQLWCQHEDNLFPASSTGRVANRRDFYRLQELTTRDLEVIQKLVINQTEQQLLRDLGKRWLDHFTALHDARRAYENNGKDAPKLEEELDVAINNFEEDLHQTVEQTGKPILDQLRSGNGDVLFNLDDYADFAFYIAMQYFRTHSMSTNIQDELGEEIPNFNLEAAWPVMRTIFATNVGAGINRARESAKLTFLQAPSNGAFITGDQPVTNLAMEDVDEQEPPDELKIYYPLKPGLAMTLGFNSSEPKVVQEEISLKSVNELNRLILSWSEEQIYSASKKSITQLD